MTACLRPWSALVMFCAVAGRLWAGGSGLNVVVVINQSSTNSLQLGNYYCEQRQVPPQNVLFINWTGGNLQWDITAFGTNLYNPLLAMLASRQLTNQIDYVVLSMDIPYSISNTTNANNNNSTTSALFYGYKPDPTDPFTQGCSIADGSTNYYAGSEGIFRSTPPISASSNSYLVTMLTSSNFALAKMIVDKGVTSDFTFPTQTVYLAKSPDVNRNIRYALFDNAIFDTRLRGNYSMLRTNTISIAGFGNMLGLELGTYNDLITGVYFAPGSMADNLTSFGGLILTDNSLQLTILWLLEAGAAGSYGTVSEPCAYLEKFPSTQNHFYQARGFSLAECYYQSVTNPYQGLLIGEPLAAPFAQPAGGTWLGLPVNALLHGTTNLSLQFTASDTNHPLQQADLFLDGLWFQTLTNIPPQPNNIVYVTLNGHPTNYTVPANATLKSVTSNLTARLNVTSYSNLTKVAAFAHGDRIELQSMDRSKSGAQVTLAVSNSIGTGAAATTFIAASRASFLDTVASGIRSFQVEGNPVTGDFLQVVVTKTNGTQITVSVTDTPGGPTNLTQMTQALLDGINTNTALMSPDGLTGQDLVTEIPGPVPPELVAFNLLANTAGWNAAQIQAAVSGSGSFLFNPSGTVALDENLPDLEPRDHLYLTAGVTNLPLTFACNTATLADGFHELTAVVYEGSHVRTQKRIATNVQIQNSSLSATFITLVGDTNSAVEATLQFSVIANTNNISKIELFSTGGLLGSMLNQSNVVFSVAGTNLGIGLHPFYAIVTGSNGKQYRTQTKWIRLVGADAPFPVAITAPPPVLAWPAAAGRSYDVLSTTNLGQVYQLTNSLTPSNSAARWGDTNPPSSQRFYRVRTSP